jgi:hypothetical protein
LNLGWFNYIAVSHEGFKSRPQILRLGVCVKRRWEGPFIAISFDVSVQVRARHVGIVRIPMGRPVQIEPHENDRLSRSILEHGFCSFNLTSGDVEHKVLALVKGRKGNRQSLAGRRKGLLLVIYTSLFHRNESYQPLVA